MSKENEMQYSKQRITLLYSLVFVKLDRYTFTPKNPLSILIFLFSNYPTVSSATYPSHNRHFKFASHLLYSFVHGFEEYEDCGLEPPVCFRICFCGRLRDLSYLVLTDEHFYALQC